MSSLELVNSIPNQTIITLLRLAGLIPNITNVEVVGSATFVSLNTHAMTGQQLTLLCSTELFTGVHSRADTNLCLSFR